MNPAPDRGRIYLNITLLRHLHKIGIENLVLAIPVHINQE